MSKYIKIKRIPYEEPYHLNLIINVSNGEQSTTFEYYDHAGVLKEWANELETFPKHSTDVLLYEIGSERPEDKWSCYLRFRVFTTNLLGACAIQFRFNNNKDLPDRVISEFCIEAEVTELNILSKLLYQFSKLEHEVLEWSGSEGELHVLT